MQHLQRFHTFSRFQLGILQVAMYLECCCVLVCMWVCFHIHIYIYTHISIYIYIHYIYIYIIWHRMFILSLGCSFYGSQMSQALATVSTGTSLALLWKIFEGVHHSPPLSLCPVRHWWEVHWPSLILGLLLGLIFGPVVEALIGLRIYLCQVAIRRLVGHLSAGPAPRPLHRLV